MWFKTITPNFPLEACSFSRLKNKTTNPSCDFWKSVFEEIDSEKEDKLFSCEAVKLTLTSSSNSLQSGCSLVSGRNLLFFGGEGGCSSWSRCCTNELWPEKMAAFLYTFWIITWTKYAILRTNTIWPQTHIPRLTSSEKEGRAASVCPLIAWLHQSESKICRLFLFVKKKPMNIGTMKQCVHCWSVTQPILWCIQEPTFVFMCLNNVYSPDATPSMSSFSKM